jgi:acetyl-CoA acetyltransferase
MLERMTRLLPNSSEAGYSWSIAQRNMHEYCTTMEQLGEIAAGVPEFAGLNPNAMYRDPITAEDVVSSRMIANPLAKDPKQRVYVSGAAGAQTHWNISQMPDFTVTAGAKAGPIAFERAGVTPADIDTINFYDSFTITALLLLEDLGFAPRARAASSSRRATCAVVATCRSTPTAAACPRATRGCAGSSC